MADEIKQPDTETPVAPQAEQNKPLVELSKGENKTAFADELAEKNRIAAKLNPSAGNK